MITAKVRCTSKFVTGEGENRSANVSFGPDYAEGRNAQWAKATPTLSLSMTVNASAVDLFEPSQCYTLVFEPEQESTADATAEDSAAESSAQLPAQPAPTQG